MSPAAGVDILLPTINRHAEFVMALCGIATQTLNGLHVIVADQSDRPVHKTRAVQALERIIRARGGTVAWHHRKPSHGICEQRNFLLKQADADYVLYLDDDVLMESWVVDKLLEAIKLQACAFVGAFPAGPSFQHDIRPDQQAIEYWDGPVRPEAVEPGSPQWERWNLHRAANLFHASRTLAPGEFRLYKVAWISACVLYDRQKLLEVGGFEFWRRLPRYHSGEEVLVQNLLMRRWGGCGLIPAGTYFAEAPTTVLNEAGTVDGHALELLPEMIERNTSRASQPAASAKAREEAMGNYG
jgi:GT2 family glycosyltransferase